MKLKKTLLLCFLFLLLPALFFGVWFLFSRTASTSVSTPDEDFETFTHQLFCQDVASNTLTLHYTLKDPSAYGITEPEITLGNYVSGSAGHESASLQETLTRLQAFSREELSPENQLTYDIMETQLQAELALAPYGLYEEVLSPTLGNQAQLPVLLAEYPFETLEDVDIYLELLSQLDSYYESLLWFEEEKAAAGLFMWEDTCEAVMAQCQAFIEDPEENFLLATFEERIASLPFLSLDQKKAYLESNESCIKNSVIPAYERLIAGLQELKGQGRNDRGLYYYKHGQEYYQALIACTIGSGHTVPEIKELLQEQMAEDLEIINRIVRTNPQLVQKAASAAVSAPSSEEQISSENTLDSSLTLSTDMLAILEQRITDNFPAVSAVNYEVKSVHPSLENYLSPAFYLTPPIDDLENHTIYINNASDYDTLSLFTTLAHEGYPGHLYQSLYESSCDPDPVRSLFYFGGYTEGWATYAERCSYSYAGLEPNLAQILAANNMISLGIYAQADIGIHYDGWSLEQTAVFLENYGIQSRETAENIYAAILEAPSNYLKYYLGYVEIEELKEQAQTALDESFTLKEFHEFILSTGPAPFPVLEKHMEAWIQKQ